MAGILPQIEHIVAVMLENRPFDNMCGIVAAEAVRRGYDPALVLDTIQTREQARDYLRNSTLPLR